MCDELGPAASLMQGLDEAGIQITRISGAEHAQACGQFVDAVQEDRLRHLGSVDLWNAIRSSGTRPLVDRWVWSRTRSAADISPLVASTLALWAAMAQPEWEVAIY